MKRFRVILALLLVAFLAGLAFFGLSPHEPSCAGRPLSSWLRQLDDGDTQIGLPWETWQPSRSVKQAEAAEAIRQMGTNTLPYLLHSLTNQDSSLRVKIMELLAKQRWIKIPPSTNHMHRAAALAFDVLGPTAKGAVPDLVRILNEPPPNGHDSEKCTTIALAAIPEGRAALIQMVVSNGATATHAIWGLASHRVIVPTEVIQILLVNLTNNVGGNGAVAAFALGLLEQDPEHVVPALISGLKAKDLGTRWGSAYSLGYFGTNAASAIPALSEVLKDQDTVTRGYAERALEMIYPKAEKK